MAFFVKNVSPTTGKLDVNAAQPIPSAADPDVMRPIEYETFPKMDGAYYWGTKEVYWPYRHPSDPRPPGATHIVFFHK